MSVPSSRLLEIPTPKDDELLSFDFRTEFMEAWRAEAEILGLNVGIWTPLIVILTPGSDKQSQMIVYVECQDTQN